jgi:hypothetical protein
MHDTHPLLSYFPKEPVPTCSGWWCRDSETLGWTPKTYTAEDRTIVSWHELRSRSAFYGNTWGVEATFTGGFTLPFKLSFFILS